ncbi:MAG TPA: SAM-dependent methyltransferase [Chthoniobacterales bacterium]|nr:SAM-dependent methyltransferase [Chthoniobacterales bacterium]
MLRGDQALADLIREKIRREGPITFAAFMEQALYHPQLGYYSSDRCQIGRRGDYFTNVSVGPLFGRILAAQFEEMWRILGQPDPFTIVEQGAHHGEFAKDVLDVVRQDAPDFSRTLRYAMIEPFPTLRARQEEALAEYAGSVSWRDSLQELEPFSGVHFSNELLDAMPVHVVRRRANGDWEEVRVGDSPAGFVFTAEGIADEKLRGAVAKSSRSIEGDYETEINLAAPQWIELLAQKLSRGFVLAVDYGYSRAEYRAPSRTTGTLQAYARHRRLTSPLEEIGCADITAHVEWTSIAERAEEAGLKVVGFADQHHFITGLLSGLTIDADQRRGLQTLLHPEFLGTRFQYLALGKDVPEKGLSGYQFAREPRKSLGL